MDREAYQIESLERRVRHLELRLARLEEQGLRGSRSKPRRPHRGARRDEALPHPPAPLPLRDSGEGAGSSTRAAPGIQAAGSGRPGRRRAGLRLHPAMVRSSRTGAGRLAHGRLARHGRPDADLPQGSRGALRRARARLGRGYRPCRSRHLLPQPGLQPGLDHRADAGGHRPDRGHRRVRCRSGPAGPQEPAGGQRPRRGRAGRRVRVAVRGHASVRADCHPRRASRGHSSPRSPLRPSPSGTTRGVSPPSGSSPP